MMRDPIDPFDPQALEQQALLAQLSQKPPTGPPPIDGSVGSPTPGVSTTQPVPPPPWANPTASGGTNTSINAPRLPGNTLTEHGNTRTLQPGEVAGAQGYVDDFWKQFPTGFQPGVGPQTNADYGPPPGASRTGWNGLNLDAPPPTNLNQFSGFNMDRALAGGDPNSTKDAFARWASGQNFNLMGASKDQIGDFMRQNMGSAKQYGLNILDVQGDQMLVQTRESATPVWVDFVQNAGGANPAWAWQQQDGTTASPGRGSTISPLAQSGAAVGVGMPTALSQQSQPLGNDTTFQQVMAAIQALQQGQQNPLELDALLKQLGIG